ncbi:cytochrome C [Azospira restricta]|uniref:Cytochrome C n=1 Tax=Azospira restricta TaxID=404405 RepID=A0A974Y3A0_9RHOO|nr:cytochrome C [Azospira restricta]QRJ63770.1 cytochrome C [Azospira restricta]
MKRAESRQPRSALWLCGLLLAAAAVFGAVPAAAANKLDNAGCLSCHDGKKGKIEVPGKDGEKRALAHVDTRKFGMSIHSEMRCVACHQEITDSRAQHRKNPQAQAPNCITCHEQLWADARRDKLTQEKERLGLVVQNIADYRKSFHARPDADDPTRAKAFCEDCHGSHEFRVPPQGSERRTAWHKEIPETCGAKCHEDQLESYLESVHGEELVDKGNVKAAVCTDCHSAHRVVNTSTDNFKLANVNTCGDCHKKQLNSYTDTYHGQVNRLGYTYTARCVDCHRSHDVKAVEDPNSTVHPKNRMKTCMKCHSDKKPGMHDATPGFASFAPHATTDDFEKYPQMFIASKFMVALLIFVFAFFWAHSGLWYYREWKDRQAGKAPPHIDTKGLVLDTGKHFRRFPLGWRIAHLVFALVTMTLVLTGTSALYAESAWAPVVAKAVGGPKMLGLIHRVAAFLFIGIFMIHFVYVMQKLLRDRTFRWFGPDSLIPNWKDFADCWGMFKWFFGKGPRPLFDRWAYYEKFDYWAVFWGVNIIGWSGLMLAFPHVTAQFLPGWVFNVGTLVHGEEAFLAAVFLFTVHFFNNHFRPDKLPPPDVVMFTGTQSLEEFRHDHPAHYQRLVDSGEITQYLVDPPSRQFHGGSVALGLALIAVGLVLLLLVGVGFFTT